MPYGCETDRWSYSRECFLRRICARWRRRERWKRRKRIKTSLQIKSGGTANFHSHKCANTTTHTSDFVPDYKYPSTVCEYRHVFFCVFHESPRFHLGHVSAVDSVLTGQYIRIDNGAIQRALYVSFSLSSTHCRSLHPPHPPLLPLFIRALVARQIGECAGSFCEIPAYIVLSRLINASMDSIFYVIHSDCFVLQKNTKWARLDSSSGESSSVNIEFSRVINNFFDSFYFSSFLLSR